MSFYGNSGGDTNFRRTWDTDEYRRKANEREQALREKELGVKKKDESKEPKSLLKAREDVIDFSKVINTTQVIQATSGVTPGFECKICGTVAKDNASYLDHINGRKHQRNLGMSMKVEKSTAEQVKARLEMLAKMKNEPEEKIDLETRVKRAREEEEEIKQRRKEVKRLKKEAKKAAKKDQETAVVVEGLEGLDEPDMAAMMGFSGFGGSKKNK